MLIGGNEPENGRPGRTITGVDDALTRVVGRLGMSAALLLSAVTYAAVGLALPLSIGAGGFLFISLNVLGVAVAWLLNVVWLFSVVQATQRRHLLEWTTNLRLLSSEEFEWVVGELLRREGWDVTETGREGPDGNVDLRIRRGRQEKLVQCKRWQSNKVGVDEIRKLAGTLMREKLTGRSGIFVTLSRFTEPASEEAKKLGIELIDGTELARRIERARASEPCPDCGAPMRLDRSQHGWWLRCPRWSNGCRGKRDLGNEPGRAVELLLTDA